MQFSNKGRYEGQYENGFFSGKGLYMWPDGRKYEGQWTRGIRQGEGVLTFPSGEKYGMKKFSF